MLLRRTGFRWLRQNSELALQYLQRSFVCRPRHRPSTSRSSIKPGPDGPAGSQDRALQQNAPSAIAVVDPAGDLLAFQRMDGVRPASAELAIQKARTAARLQRPTAEIEDAINKGRTAFITSGTMVLRGGMPIRLNSEVVGAVGIAGLSKETDTGIASVAAAALNSPQKASEHH
ncbi:heme-binding protein [Bradyrhizobium sp. ARR65]|uniref:GlcG/HbpS family heme-binding protein n=1 Tax=Bradyrhizobium sp. ARR65 TaxID=1040989 RepID=UPI000464DE5B|nr:heme-binding protein [Bradyrhizobium sp. ARR65]